MPVIRSHEAYFRLVKGFHQAPAWQKELLMRGTLLTRCNDLEPASIRLRLRNFWTKQAALMGLDAKQLQTWG